MLNASEQGEGISNQKQPEGDLAVCPLVGFAYFVNISWWSLESCQRAHHLLLSCCASAKLSSDGKPCVICQLLSL